MASTKFQPTYARRAFPCFDEPSFKSTWTVSVVRPSTHIVLSNMPEESTVENSPANGLATVTFQKSVPMVSYLVVVVVCEFTMTEKLTDVHSIPFSVYGKPGDDEQLKYALKVGTEVADEYETYFDVKYPLPKLDMAAIPDYSSGATEHWGMITYRETALLFDEEKSSSANKARVAGVIAHEMAHQWFGNLMTVDW